MTLLIALMGNELVRTVAGHEFVHPLWIFVTYFGHLLYHARSSK